MIGVIDYGAGNIKSVLNALNFVDSKNDIKLITAPQELAKCQKLILPGVGAFKDAMDKMVDHSCDEKTEEQLRACVLQNPDVARIDLLQTRIFGNKIYADIEIEVDGSMPLREAHKIAESVHNSIEKTFPKVKHIMVHVNPEIDRK